MKEPADSRPAAAARTDNTASFQEEALPEARHSFRAGSRPRLPARKCRVLVPGLMFLGSVHSVDCLLDNAER
jgi:hypothetical protein